MEKIYRGYMKGLVVTGHANNLNEFIENQKGFKLHNITEVKLIDGEWKRLKLRRLVIK